MNNLYSWLTYMTKAKRNVPFGIERGTCIEHTVAYEIDCCRDLWGYLRDRFLFQIRLNLAGWGQLEMLECRRDFRS